MENLKKRIFFSTILAIVIGTSLNIIGKDDRTFQTHVIASVAILYKVFIFIMQVILLPMIIFSIINSSRMIVKAIKNSKLGNVTLLFFSGTTLIAILMSIFLSEKLIYLLDYNLDPLTRYTNNIFININSSNFYWIISEGLGNIITKYGLLITIFCSFMFGILIELTEKSWINGIKDLIEKGQIRLSGFLKKLIQIIFIPVFGYCLVIFSLMGLKVFAVMVAYGIFITMILIIFAILVYGSMVKFFNGMNIIEFYKNITPLWKVVFRNPNSNDVLPVTISTAINKFKINEKTTEFVLGMGKSMNRHGTAIMQCMSVLLMAKIYGVPMGFLEIVSLSILVFLMAQGTFSIPFDGIITMTILFQFFGIPIESIFLILGIDKTFEALRTSVNVIGDVVCAAVVDKKINELK